MSQSPPIPDLKFFPKLRGRYYLLLGILGLLQLALDFSLVSAGCVTIIGIAAWLTARSLLRPTVFPRYPLSTLAVFVYSVVTQPMAMLGTLLDGHAVTYLLLDPLTTFGWIAFTQMLLLAGHAIYRRFTFCETVRADLSGKLFLAIGLFTVPTAIQLWVLGFTGIAAMFIAGAGGGEGGALFKFVAAFIPLMYAPFLIVLHRFVDERSRRLGQVQTAVMVLYFLIVLGLSLVINSRGGFAMVFAMLAYTLILGLFTGRISSKLLRPRYVIPLCIGGLIGLMAFSQLALSMQVARKYRGQASPLEMVKITMGALVDPARVRALEQFQSSEVMNGNFGFWDERYISNVLLARLVPVRFHDLTLHAVSLYGPGAVERVRSYSLSRFYAMFPSPLLRLVGINVNKEFLNLFSVGDYMYFAATNKGLGVHRTGSFIAQGLVLFGPVGFAIFVLALCVACSVVLDSLMLRKGLQVRFSSLSILFIVPLAQIYAVESVNFQIEFFIRFLPQTILIYLLAFHGTRMFAGFGGTPQTRLSPRPRIS